MSRDKSAASDVSSEALDSLQGMAHGFMSMLPMLVVGVLVFFVFLGIAFVVRRILRRLADRSEFPGAATAFSRIATFGILLLGGLVSVTVAFPSMTPGKLFSVLGFGGVAIGFAFKDIFQNLVAGILLLLRHPFRTGDEITSGSFTGTVESIEPRATYIRTYDGRRIIVPNSVIYTEPVTVITAYDLLRSQYDVGIGYGDDVARAKEIALQTLREIEGVLSDPAPDALLWDLAGSSQNVRIRWWTRPVRANVVQTRDRVLSAVAKALAEAGIDLPFPTQVVLFHDQTETIDGDRTKQREGWPAGKNPPQPRAQPRTNGSPALASDGARTAGSV